MKSIIEVERSLANKIVIVSKDAAIKFENRYSITTEIIAEKIPKTRAWFLVSLPVGIGLRHVLVINESKSDSYHIFSAPAAPEPKATAVREQIAFIKSIFTGAINNPTAQVKITKDITLGFIKLKKALI